MLMIPYSILVQEVATNGSLSNVGFHGRQRWIINWCPVIVSIRQIGRSRGGNQTTLNYWQETTESTNKPQVLDHALNGVYDSP